MRYIYIYNGYVLLINWSLYHYIMMKNYIFKVFTLKNSWFDISGGAPLLFGFHLHVMSFHPLILSLCVSLKLRWVPYRQFIVESLPTHYPFSNSLYLFINNSVYFHCTQLFIGKNLPPLFCWLGEFVESLSLFLLLLYFTIVQWFSIVLSFEFFIF